MHHLDLSYNVGTRLKDLELSIPGSKSFAARLLILGSLYPREFTIINCPDCTDVVNLENSLKNNPDGCKALIGTTIIEEDYFDINL